MNTERVNKLTAQLVAICKQEKPETVESEIWDDAKKAVEEILSGPEAALNILKYDENLVLLFAKFILRNSKHTNFADSLFKKYN